MPKDYSRKNLQNASFHNADLISARFVGSDLRGADFSGSDLTGADFTKVKTGITPLNTVWIFLAALVVSAISGYIAMLAGHTIQGMLASTDRNIRDAGTATVIIVILFIAFSYWKGCGTAIRNLLLPASLLAILIGFLSYVTGAGTGMGMLYQIVAIFLVAIMFIVGTVARAAAGTLPSTILFLIVALGGGMFGKSLGGGIGTIIMALSCAQISKRALSGASGFEALRKIAFAITSKFGTSFRDSKLVNANFTRAIIHNADFSNSDISSVKWGDSKKINCVTKQGIILNKQP